MSDDGDDVLSEGYDGALVMQPDETTSASTTAIKEIRLMLAPMLLSFAMVPSTN
jgi:hypothetical protein